jgi:hypothetical protein
MLAHHLCSALVDGSKEPRMKCRMTVLAILLPKLALAEYCRYKIAQARKYFQPRQMASFA